MIPSRRELLKLGMGATAIACGNSIPRFVAETAVAAPATKLPERILVVVELEGGNDGLNTVIPYRDDAYRKSRPTLQVAAESVLKIDGRLGFHPSMRGMAKMLEDRRLAIVQSVGYPNPNRSHFQSMSIWHTGDPAATLASNGWLSAYIERNSRPGRLDSIALHVDDAVLPQALRGSDFQVPSANQIEMLQRHVGVPASQNPARQLSALDRVISEPRGEAGSHLRFVQQNSALSFVSSARLSRLLRSAKQSTASYRYARLGGRLRMISQLIRAELGTVIYYTRLGGFDSHANQQFQHANLLTELSDSVLTFFDDLAASGVADRVVMFMFSEFGRRLAENGAKGTDHGTAGPVFLAGPAVRAGIHGPYPNLTNLVDGDPKYAVDFRDIYASLLKQWLGAKIPARKTSLSLIKS